MRYASIAGYLLLIGALGGCALGRDVVTVKAPEASTVTASNGKSVRIESVLDGRKFEAAPSQADIPSLDPDADNGPDAKSRAIARKRGGFGKALGDVALPEGQSVSGLVEQAISTGFKESGYTVVKKGDANYESATPVSARINQFWAWFSPGAWSVKVSQKSEIELNSAVIQPSGTATISTNVSESKGAVTVDDWKDIVEKGLKAITEETRKILSR